MSKQSPEKPVLRKLVIAGVLLAMTGAGATSLLYRISRPSPVAELPILEREAPRVAVSIAPLHSLVSAVMSGAGTPDLIMDAGRSPHGYALKPSDALTIDRADLVVWVGPELETAFARSLSGIQEKHPERVMEIKDLEGMTLYPVRSDAALEDSGAHDDDHADHDDHDGHEAEGPHAEPAAAHDGDDDHGHHHHEGELDAHLWLDPKNAAVVVQAVARHLADIDPGNADLYAENARTTLMRLDVLDAKIREEMGGPGAISYVSFHDGFQYFDKRYGAQPAGFLTFHPETPLSAARTVAVRDLLTRHHIPCLFAEPQFSRDVVDRLIAGTPAKALTVDPLGYGITPGPDLYFETLERIAHTYSACHLPASASGAADSAEPSHHMTAPQHMMEPAHGTEPAHATDPQHTTEPSDASRPAEAPAQPGATGTPDAEDGAAAPAR
ncbi:zinc ABC transporter substrate-binding protein [Phaeovibrio sulfidiphilus]|uniref:High-affinity zinc uptake system protein ZnuA n=1 Tax=Phaeovibrio sulfidiphilus TaxID=1220600 RepID=A0A8J6YQB2_9PROT|nr:zinc ABC transporter substrate-binding protein [Phaeovibrio sulfidiphilus]MBE1237751.1 zinc ABC transporter substrate-binding protein [Phaeovibrio sulfidiphilus]